MYLIILSYLHFPPFNYQQYHEVHKSINKCYFYSLHFERGIFTNQESEEIDLHLG